MIRDSAVSPPRLPYPAVIVHGLEDACTALCAGMPLTLLSAPGAALYAGCLWWWELVRLARQKFPAIAIADALDCADAAGRALQAIRIGQACLILSPASPGFAAVAAVAEARGICLLRERPPALNMAERGASRRLAAWLATGSHVDRSPPLG
jgi:hypothetical protein